MIENSNISKRVSYKTEKWSGHVLRVGLWVSGGLMIAGLIIASLFPSNVNVITENPSLGKLFYEMFSDSLNPVVLMFAGLVLLMFTPILRVVTAIVGFAVERDWKFVFVSLIVFILLIGEIIYSIMIKG